MTRQKTIENLNTGLGVFIGVSGFFLRTAINLPGNSGLSIHTQVVCLSCQIFKIFTYMLLTISIIICYIGLVRQPIGEIVSPQRLKELYSSNPVIYGKGFVINTWIEKTIPQLDDVINHKGDLLQKTIIFFGLAMICFSSNIIIATLF